MTETRPLAAGCLVDPFHPPRPWDLRVGNAVDLAAPGGAQRVGGLNHLQRERLTLDVVRMAPDDGGEVSVTGVFEHDSIGDL